MPCSISGARMKLLLVTNTYPPGDISGVGSLVFELAAEARRRGSQVRVLTRHQPAAAETTRDGEDLLEARGGKIFFPLVAGLCFLRLVRGWTPEVIHVHESDGVVIVLLTRLARLLGRRWGRSRIVATLQVSYAEERRSVRPLRVDGEVVSRPVRSERLFAWIRAPILSLLGRISGRLADAVIAPSQVTAAELRRDYGIEAIEVVPNGVLARDARSPAQTAGTTVLFVGRLRTRKAVAVLLEAIGLLRKEQVAVDLRIVGNGEQEEDLRERCLALGLEESVDFVGAVARDKMDGYYASAAIFCLPSIYEGFPLAILEAMAGGLPVVSTTVSGIPEAVDDGTTGMLVEPEDARGLAAALGSLLAQPDLRRSMGIAGRQRFGREFSIERVAGLHFELFQSLLG